jgi:hypothetical protein
VIIMPMLPMHIHHHARIFRLAALLAKAAGLSAFAFAQTTVFGRITDFQGKAVIGATVKLAIA